MRQPVCQGKPSSSLLHSWQLQRSTPSVVYRCRACGTYKYGD